MKTICCKIAAVICLWILFGCASSSEYAIVKSVTEKERRTLNECEQRIKKEVKNPEGLSVELVSFNGNKIFRIKRIGVKNNFQRGKENMPLNATLSFIYQATYDGIINIGCDCATKLENVGMVVLDLISNDFEPFTRPKEKYRTGYVKNREYT